jgi:hypothetical protein
MLFLLLVVLITMDFSKLSSSVNYMEVKSGSVSVFEATRNKLKNLYLTSAEPEKRTMLKSDAM